ncbi:MAG: DUF4159 domain-containing protein [Planctomycetes bacterium]|nr:DUF4159 domain-containing protein [Planctomycetota bacterium]
MTISGKYRFFMAIAAVIASCVSASPCHAQRPRPPATKPATQPAPPVQPAPPSMPTDDQIVQAIKAGMKFIYGKIKEDGSLSSTPTGQQYPCMVESLALLAGLSAGDSSDSTFIRLLFKAASSSPTTSTAGRSARLMAMCRLGSDGMASVRSDAEWLCKQQQPSGGWNYGPGQPKTAERSGQTDSMNTHWAVWALGQASANSITLPREKDVWTKAREFWNISPSNPDGGWGYDPPKDPSKPSGIRIKGSSYGTMTVGGLASLLVLNERWSAGLDGVGGTEPPDRKMIVAAYKWLQDHFAVDHIPQYAWGDDSFEHYLYLFGLARLAGQMGLRSMDKKDVLGEIAGFLLPQQRKNGSWPAEPDAKESEDDLLYTCLVVLCLTETRRPVLISKLVPPDCWPGEGTDVAAATRLVCQKLSAQFGWQLLSDESMSGLAPILFIKRGETLQLAAQPIGKIKRLLDFGGTVLIQAANRAAAQNIAKDLKQQLAQYEIRELDKDHPVFGVQFSSPASAELAGFTLDDAIRSRVFIVGADLGAGWRAEPPKYGEFLANLLLYTTDMVVPAGRWNAPPLRLLTAPGKTIKVGRVKHAAEWYSCPRALDRLSDVLISSLRTGVQQVNSLDLSQDPPADVPLLWITGSGDPQLSPQAQANLKKYLTGGGTVFLDSTVGRPEFFRAASEMLGNLFGKDSLKPLAADCPLLTGDFGGGIGADLREVEYSRAMQKEKPDLKTPEIYGVEINGRIAVILSPHGVTCPLEGLAAFGCKGLSQNDARRLAANVLLYALSGK